MKPIEDYLYYHSPTSGSVTITSAEHADKHPNHIYTFGEYARHLDDIGLTGAALYEALERVRSADEPVTALVTELVRKYLGKTRVVKPPVESTLQDWIKSQVQAAFHLGKGDVPPEWFKVIMAGINEYNPFLTGLGQDLERAFGEWSLMIDGVEYIIPDMWEF